MNPDSRQAAESSSAVDEAILDELVAGNRARAMLFHMRHYGGTPQDAWKAIRGLAGSDESESPDRDPHVRRLEDYLKGRGSTKDKVVFLAITAGVIAIGALIVGWNWHRLVAGIDSYGWEKSSATVIEANYHGSTHYSQGREVKRVKVDYQFRYGAGGKTYRQSVKRMPFVDMFDGPRLQRGDRITIVVNPDDPSQAIHRRRMYHRVLPVVVGVLIMVPAIGLLILSISTELAHRDLEACDPAFATTKVP